MRIATISSRRAGVVPPSKVHPGLEQFIDRSFVNKVLKKTGTKPGAK